MSRNSRFNQWECVFWLECCVSQQTKRLKMADKESREYFPIPWMRAFRRIIFISNLVKYCPDYKIKGQFVFAFHVTDNSAQITIIMISCLISTFKLWKLTYNCWLSQVIYPKISKYSSWTGWQGSIHNPSTCPKVLLYIYLKYTKQIQSWNWNPFYSLFRYSRPWICLLAECRTWNKSKALRGLLHCLQMSILL